MKKTFSAFFFIGICLATVVAIAEVSHKEHPLPMMVRVAIVRDARELNLAIKGPYTFVDAISNKVIGQGLRLAKARVRLLDRGLFMGMDVYPAQRLIIKPARDASVVINNHDFRGDILLIRTPHNRLTAINSINIEDYIKGVLYHEISHHWPMEAIKAQAVAARTYALYKISLSQHSDFDVTNDIYSQVYGGKDSERYRTGLAVQRTQGEVLVYQGKILPAYYHATCGGMTEDAKELWGVDMPPLRGVPCMFCQNSPHLHWKKNFRLRDIQSALNKYGYKIGLIKNMSIVERNRSDRIRTLKITSRDGSEMTISGKDFRQIIGPNILKSNNYEIGMRGYYVDFIGKGWGHGVGLCQWGARGMAEQQFTYKQILSYYYPGSQLINDRDLKVVEPAQEDKTPVLPADIQ